MAFDGGRRRVRGTWDITLLPGGSYQRLSDGKAFHVWSYGTSVSLGYDVLQLGTFLLFPIVDTGVEGFGLVIDPAQAPMAVELLRSSGTEEVGVGRWFTSAAIGLSEFVPLWRAGGEDAAVFIDTRIGYRQRLARTGWGATADDTSHSFNGPEVNLSGPFLRVAPDRTEQTMNRARPSSDKVSVRERDLGEKSLGATCERHGARPDSASNAMGSSQSSPTRAPGRFPNPR